MWITLIYGFAKLDSHQTVDLHRLRRHNRRSHEKSGTQRTHSHTHCGDEQILHVYGAPRETMALNDLAFSQKSMGDDVCKRIVLFKARVNPVNGKLSALCSYQLRIFVLCACMGGKKLSFVCWSTRIWWKSSIFPENLNEIQPFCCAKRAENPVRKANKGRILYLQSIVWVDSQCGNLTGMCAMRPWR